MGRITQRRSVLRLDLAGPAATAMRAPDTLAGEEPLEIRVGAESSRPHPAFTVTMRTPGDDVDLALGFLVSEGVIHYAEQVRTAQLCGGRDRPSAPDGVIQGIDLDENSRPVPGGRRPENTYNVIDVALADGVPPPLSDPTRHVLTTSACGVCGKASIDAIRVRSRYDLTRDQVSVAATTLVSLPDRLRAAQRGFAATGGLHAAAVFTATGELLCVREDVGRHNAVDKVIGWALRNGRLPLTGHVLMVSGRASFELAQKAWTAGVPVLAAVSAPSTLAVDVAEAAGLTLVGFLRGATANVYTEAQRIAVDGH